MRNSHLNAVIVILSLAFILAGTYMMDQKSTPDAEAPPPASQAVMIERPVPDFILKDIRGNDINLQNYKGRVILLNFWASWCAPCIHEFPQFINLAREMEDKIIIIAVSTDDSRDKIDGFLKKLDFRPTENIIIARDPDKTISRDIFGTIRLPETIIISPHLMMTTKIAGNPIPWDSQEMKEEIEGIFSCTNSDIIGACQENNLP